ncbi:hypothetical protein QE152_g38094 [Popillia japonica]|uniref:Uncharacterized protein n=1 Tax=Popillia japonica TaxID=7064 RepID=A0AAW1I8T2_POPJA
MADAKILNYSNTFARRISPEVEERDNKWVMEIGQWRRIFFLFRFNSNVAQEEIVVIRRAAAGIGSEWDIIIIKTLGNLARFLLYIYRHLDGGYYSNKGRDDTHTKTL